MDYIIDPAVRGSFGTRILLISGVRSDKMEDLSRLIAIDVRR